MSALLSLHNSGILLLLDYDSGIIPERQTDTKDEREGMKSVVASFSFRKMILRATTGFLDESSLDTCSPVSFCLFLRGYCQDTVKISILFLIRCGEKKQERDRTFRKMTANQLFLERKKILADINS